MHTIDNLVIVCGKKTWATSVEHFMLTKVRKNDQIINLHWPKCIA